MLLDPHSDDVVVVAGLPGAGKTTLVAGESRALDSDAVREGWRPRLGAIPYPLWRPLVHAAHWLAIWRALKRPEGVILVRPFTHGWTRRALLRAEPQLEREPWTTVTRLTRADEPCPATSARVTGSVAWPSVSPSV